MSWVHGYYLTQKIGSGGFGEVWRAVDEDDRVFAVKLPRDAEERVHLAALAREGRLLEDLDHPSIVEIVGIHQGSDTDPPAIVMEYLPEGSLRDRLLEPREPFPALQAVRVLYNVVLGLEAAHRAGLAHGDLKPSNVLVRNLELGDVCLTDFGLAQMTEEELQQSLGLTNEAILERAGTMAYMSPERLAGGPPDVESDVYALGVLACEIVTGRLPEGRDVPSEMLGELAPWSGTQGQAMEVIDQLFESCYTARRRRAPLESIRNALKSCLDRAEVPGHAARFERKKGRAPSSESRSEEPDTGPSWFGSVLSLVLYFGLYLGLLALSEGRPNERSWTIAAALYGDGFAFAYAWNAWLVKDVPGTRRLALVKLVGATLITLLIVVPRV